MATSTPATVKQQFARRQSATLRDAAPATRAVWPAELAITRFDFSRVPGLIVALPLVVFLAAVWALMLFPSCGKQRRIGRHGRAFDEFHWHNLTGVRGALVRRLRLTALPRVWNLVRGDLALVGPRLEEWREIPSSDRRLRRCREAAPGLLSLFRLRRMTNIDFEDELTTEVGYVESRCGKSDLGLLFRLALTSFYGGVSTTPPSRVVRHLGIQIDNLKMREACDWIAERARGSEPPCQVSFVNAHCMNVSCTDAQYREVVRSSALVLADGIGMKLAGKLLRQPVVQNVNGTDLFPLLCKQLGEQGSSIFLLGGKPGVPEEVEGWIRNHYPACNVVGTHHGYVSGEEEAGVAEQIRQSGASVLLVAMGVPAQEKWIARNLDRTGAAVAIGAGGLFDFYSNRIPRAPQWLREMGLEWAYRLRCEPRRMWRRYIVGNVLFLARVLRERRKGPATYLEEA